MKIKIKNIVILMIIIMLVLLINPNVVKAHGDYSWITTYYANQCTWYACGRVNEVLGINIDKHWGDAWQWAQSARNAGYTVDYNPAPNTVAVWPQGQYGSVYQYGHVAFVESVNGNSMYITEYNYYNPLAFGSVTCSTTDSRGYGGKPQFIHFGDTEKPIINEIVIDPTKVTDDTIQVKVKASDNVGVTKVKFRIWRSNNHSDSGTAKWGTYNSSTGYWEVTFYESDIKIMSDDLCRVDAWASDAAGNESEGAYIYDFYFGNRVSGLGNFIARIVPKKDTNYCIGTSGDNNDDNLKLRRKNQTDTSQLWKFEEISTGIYNRRI